MQWSGDIVTGGTPTWRAAARVAAVVAALALTVTACTAPSTPVGAATFDDPDGLLRWLGPDRARLDFADAADLAQRTPALQALLRRWITLL